MVTVDVHSHVYLPKYLDLLRSRTKVPFVRPDPLNPSAEERLFILPSEDEASGSTRHGRPISSTFSSPALKLAFMDQHRIDHSVISLANPWLDFLPPDAAGDWATVLNDELYSWCGDRLSAFGVLPVLSVEKSISEVYRLSQHRSDRVKGVIMGTNGLGAGLDDPKLDPLWKALSDSQLMIFLHPHYGLGEASEALYGPRNDYGHVLPLAFGFPFETSVTVSRMILSGTFDRFPKLNMLLAHSGGCLPFLSGRLQSCIRHDFLLAGRLKRTAHEYLSGLYYDAVNYHEYALNCVADQVGMDRVFFGTDHPFFEPVLESEKDQLWASVEMNRAAIKKAGEKKDNPAFSEAIMGENAARVLGITTFRSK